MTSTTGPEARLAAALDRIEAGLGRLAAADALAAAEAEVARLNARLDAEKSAQEQLAARVTELREKQERTVATLEARLVALQDRASEQMAEIGRLTQVNAALRATSRALREAAEAGVLDAGHINRALEAEVAALHAVQAADRRELDAIIGELAPLLEDSAHG